MKAIGITILTLAGIAVLCVAATIAYLASPPFSVQEHHAERLIRHYLRYQAGERYVELYRAGAIDAHAASDYQEVLDAIEGLRFESVKVGRLFPDYLLNDGWPAYYARTVIRDAQDRLKTRYFNLGTGRLMVGESSRMVWLLVL